MIPPQPVPVRCPRCQTPFEAPVQSIINVKEAPGLKDDLLVGRLNVATCPACGARLRVSSPLFYYDPAKELAVAFMPLEMGLPQADQDHLIGSMANALTESLPAEERRFYILNPKVVLSQQGLLETILEADGVTREMLEAQANRARLLGELLDNVDDEATLARLVEADKDSIDYEFYLMIAGLMENAQEIGAPDEAARLAVLRDRLIALTGGPSQPLPEPLTGEVSDEAVIQQLLDTDPQALLTLVAVNRPRFDYVFFQTLTNQMEATAAAGDADKAARLGKLRDDILAAADTVDREMQASLRQGATLLQTILSSDDPPAAIQQHLSEINDAFLLVLSANIQQAYEDGRNDVAQMLEGLYAYILARLELELPTELQLVNRLLRLAEPAQRAEVLAAEASYVTPALADALEHVATEATEQSRAELAQQARTIAQEVRARLAEGA
ncbi:MAG: hypothetical protein KIS91_09695 [Anaerolineae bacterium]|nr:hypothetical protein [Anaerolineae bacterium]